MKRALVLSGGGAKGAFQVGALEWLIDNEHMTFDIIAGVSTGALQAVMLAMGKWDRLKLLWLTIKREDIMTGSMGWMSAVKMALGKKSIYGNKPIYELLKREVKGELISDDIMLIIGAACLRTGEFVEVQKHWSNLTQFILASTAIPIIWEPVQISASYRDMVDGGVRNVCPLGSVLKYDPDEIIIINCSAPAEMAQEKEFDNALEIGQRTIDILTNEIFRTDLSEFLRINDLVAQVDSWNHPHFALLKSDGTPYKHFEHRIIQPEIPLGETLDFDRAVLNRRWRHGFQVARQSVIPA